MRNIHAHVSAAHFDAAGFSPRARADTKMPTASLKKPVGVVQIRLAGGREHPAPKTNRAVIGVERDTEYHHDRDRHSQTTIL